MGGFLEREFRGEIDEWLNLCSGLFESAAEEMGYKPTKQTIRVVMAMLDAATSWCNWSGKTAELEAYGDQAIVLSRAILSSQQNLGFDEDDQIRVGNWIDVHFDD